jgi:diguanylate cyclase (GGDEF)-like protein
MGMASSRTGFSLSSSLPDSAVSGVEVSLLDALPASVAILDPKGTVLFVNRSWSDFAARNAGLQGTDAIGANFVDAGFWASEHDAPCDDVARACAGIRAVLNGTIDCFVLDYQCHTPIREHWLELRVSPVPLETGTGAVLMQMSISDRVRSADRAWRRANYDALTDLPNRSLLRDRLTQALALARRQGGEGAVLLVDVEHLCEVNRRFGHEAGDQVLQQVAERLRAHVRQSDSVARIGEDEFAVLAPRIEPAEALGTLRSKLAETLGEPYLWPGGTVEAAVKMAVCVFPGSFKTAAEVIDAGLAALTRAERDARGG